MKKKEILLAFDIGNTRTKIGVWEKGQDFTKIHISKTVNIEVDLPNVLATLPQNSSLIIASISTAKPFDIQKLMAWEHFDTQFISLDANFPFPIPNDYSTPQTLGTDRIVAVIGAKSLLETPQALIVLGAGTALTYDILDIEGRYKGGAISLGIQMRFRALHEFTARLPLLSEKITAPLIGDSTQSSINSGVLNGIISEIESMVTRYQQALNTPFQVFLTGGDSPYLAQHLRLPCILEPHLILKGIRLLAEGVLPPKLG